MRVTPSKTFLIEINIPIAYMPENSYIQQAKLSEDKKRFFITKSHRTEGDKKGSGACGRSISVKSATVLACGIIYWKD
jgi:hypothetical protein